MELYKKEAEKAASIMGGEINLLKELVMINN